MEKLFQAPAPTPEPRRLSVRELQIQQEQQRLIKQGVRAMLGLAEWPEATR